MTKRLIITAAVAVAVAVPAPAAFASGPLGPPQATLDAPTTAEEGAPSPPDTSGPEAEEVSTPAPVEEGVSTSPGGIAATDPLPVIPTDGENGGEGGDSEEGSDDEEFTCSELADIADDAMNTARAAWKIHEVIGNFTDAYLNLSNNSANLWGDAMQQLDDQGCDEDESQFLE